MIDLSSSLMELPDSAVVKTFVSVLRIETITKIVKVEGDPHAAHQYRNCQRTFVSMSSGAARQLINNVVIGDLNRQFTLLDIDGFVYYAHSSRITHYGELHKTYSRFVGFLRTHTGKPITVIKTDKKTGEILDLKEDDKLIWFKT